MPRNRMMDMMMMRDGRNPYGSAGGYITSRDPRRMRRDRRRDRGMYDGGHYGVPSGEHYSMDGNYSNSQYNDERGRRDYESGRQYDMGYDYPRMNDGHYGSEGKTYYPIEAMGTFNGYWGQPQRDFGRYDMRGRDMMGDYGDYGETLTKEEIEEWKHKLMKEVEDKDRHFFEPQNIEQKARQMGVEMKDYKPEELALTALMIYTDYCKTLKKYIGANMDIYIELARDWLTDPDSEAKGSKRLALYHDEIIMGDDD